VGSVQLVHGNVIPQRLSTVNDNRGQFATLLGYYFASRKGNTWASGGSCFDHCAGRPPTRSNS
jgi:hypothetical protein